MLKKLLTLTLSLLLAFSVIPMAMASADETTYTYVVYDNMSGTLNGSDGSTVSTSTDNMSITVTGGMFLPYPGTYITGYKFAQWHHSNLAKSIVFGLKNVEAGMYTLAVYTADNNQARGAFDVTANEVSLGSMDCLDTKLSGKKYVEHAFSTQFVANGTDDVTVTLAVNLPEGRDSTQLFIHSLVLDKVGEYTPETPSETDGLTTDAIATEDGASIRVTNVNGMRFYTSVDDAKLAELVGENDYTIGTIIAPASSVGTYFTHEDDNIDIVYDDINNDLWEGNKFVGSIVKLKAKNIGLEFIARGYVKVGDTYYYSATTTTRSLQAVATSVQNDAEEYATYTDAQKVFIDTWAAGNAVVGENE